MSGAICHDVAVLGEILDQHLDRQAALHFELAVDALPRLLQHLVGKVGGDHIDAPSGDVALHLFQQHRQRVRLLAGRGGRAPDPNGARASPRRGQRRQHRGAEILERQLVAKEERFVGHHGFDDGRHQRLGVAALERSHQTAEAAEAGLAGDRQQAALDQILLVGGEDEARALLEAFAQKIVVERRHERSPQNRLLTFAAMRSSGSTAEHKPACATDRGMPHTTLVASS